MRIPMRKRIVLRALFVLITFNAYALTELINHNAMWLQIALITVLVVASFVIMNLRNKIDKADSTADMYREENYKIEEKNDDYFVENKELKDKLSSARKKIRKLESRNDAYLVKLRELQDKIHHQNKLLISKKIDIADYLNEETAER